MILSSRYCGLILSKNEVVVVNLSSSCRVELTISFTAGMCFLYVVKVLSVLVFQQVKCFLIDCGKFFFMSPMTIPFFASWIVFSNGTSDAEMAEIFGLISDVPFIELDLVARATAYSGTSSMSARWLTTLFTIY